MVKVISLSEEAYNALVRIKNEYSFSELILKILHEKEEKENQKKHLKEYCGILKGEHVEEWEEIKQKIYADRKRSGRKWQL